jgi:hypothetical protein
MGLLGVLSFRQSATFEAGPDLPDAVHRLQQAIEDEEAQARYLVGLAGWATPDHVYLHVTGPNPYLLGIVGPIRVLNQIRLGNLKAVPVLYNTVVFKGAFRQDRGRVVLEGRFQLHWLHWASAIGYAIVFVAGIIASILGWILGAVPGWQIVLWLGGGALLAVVMSSLDARLLPGWVDTLSTEIQSAFEDPGR